MVVAQAVRNAWALTFGPGIADPPSPEWEILYDEPHRQLRRLSTEGAPVLLVPPLAVPARCFDFRPGESLAQFLVDHGFATYLIDYGTMTAADRDLGFEDWIDDILPAALMRVSAEHDGGPVHVVSWSLGGHFALLTAADHPELPIASVTALGTPIDYTANPLIAPFRIASRLTGGREVDMMTGLFGGIPAPLVQASFRAVALQRELTKPMFAMRNLTNTPALARMQSVDRFIGAMPGYPARLYRQVHHRFYLRNELVKGSVQLSADRVIELSKVEVPVLLVGSRADTIAPAATVAHGVRPLVNADVRYVEVGGSSHLGLVASPTAPTTIWPSVVEFLQN